MTLKSKTNLFYSFIIISVVISVFLTYRRAFITKDFEIIKPESSEESAQSVTTPVDTNSTELQGFEVSTTTASTTTN